RSGSHAKKIACRIRNSCVSLSRRRRTSDIFQRWRLPGAVGFLDGFCDGQDQLVFKRTADHLNADGQSVIRKGDGDGRAGKTSQVQPLGESHGVAVTRAGEVVSLAVAEGGACGNRGEQDGRVLHLAKNLGTEKIPI